MKIVMGLFESNEAFAATGQLVRSGFTTRDISLITSAADIPRSLADEIEGEPENSAVAGWIVGSLFGGTAGALSAWAASLFIPGFEVLSLGSLMTILAGGTIGAFLGGLYSTRAESQTYIDVHDETENGKVLLVVRANTAAAGTAAAILKDHNGKDVEIHPMPLDGSFPVDIN